MKNRRSSHLGFADSFLFGDDQFFGQKKCQEDGEVKGDEVGLLPWGVFDWPGKSCANSIVFEMLGVMSC